MKKLILIMFIFAIVAISYYTGYSNGQAGVYEKYENGPSLEELYSGDK